MAQRSLTCDTLGDLDGGAARLIIDREIRTAVDDTDDRGADKQSRKVTIELTFERRDNGDIETSVRTLCRLPPRRTASTVARVQGGGDSTQLVFQQFEPTDPRQRTIDEAAHPE